MLLKVVTPTRFPGFVFHTSAREAVKFKQLVKKDGPILIEESIIMTKSLEGLLHGIGEVALVLSSSVWTLQKKPMKTTIKSGRRRNILADGSELRNFKLNCVSE